MPLRRLARDDGRSLPSRLAAAIATGRKSSVLPTTKTPAALSMPAPVWVAVGPVPDTPVGTGAGQRGQRVAAEHDGPAGDKGWGCGRLVRMCWSGARRR